MPQLQLQLVTAVHLLPFKKMVVSTKTDVGIALINVCTSVAWVADSVER